MMTEANLILWSWFCSIRSQGIAWLPPARAEVGLPVGAVGPELGGSLDPPQNGESKGEREMTGTRTTIAVFAIADADHVALNARPRCAEVHAGDRVGGCADHRAEPNEMSRTEHQDRSW